MVAVGFRAKLMVPDGCFDSAFIQSAGPENLNDRTFATFGGIPPEEPTGLGAAFVEKYRATYGRQPEAYSVYSYVAAQVGPRRDRQGRQEGPRGDPRRGRLLPDRRLRAGPVLLRRQRRHHAVGHERQVVRNGKFEFVSRLTAGPPTP